MPGVFPDYEAPVVRAHQSGRELIRKRWGMPPPKFGGPPGRQYPQHVFASLAQLTEAGKLAA